MCDSNTYFSITEIKILEHLLLKTASFYIITIIRRHIKRKFDVKVIEIFSSVIKDLFFTNLLLHNT